MVQTTSHIFSGKVDIESNLLVGSSHLFVDTINNRVGITTANPDASLHVGGNVFVESNVGVGSNINLDSETGYITAVQFRGDGSNLSGVLTSLQNATDQGATSNVTIQLTNEDTSLSATGNIEVGGSLIASNIETEGKIVATTFGPGNASNLTGIVTTLQAVSGFGNSTSNTILFTNTGTSLKASGTIESAGVQVNGLDVGFDRDVTSNAIRVTNIETDIGLITQNVSDLQQANTVQRTLISELRTDVTSNTSRISSLETDRFSNTVRISLLESANIIQGDLITDIRTDITSNTSRITALETANTVQRDLITDIRTDITSNTSRIDVLETANTVQRDLITDIEADITSNASRISILEYANNVIQRDLIQDLRNDLTSNTTRVETLEGANVVQESLINDLRTDLTSNTAKIATNQTTISSHSGLISGLLADMNSNSARITVLETGSSTQSTDITNLQTDLSSNASRVTVLEGQRVDHENRISTLETDTASNVSRIVVLEEANTVQGDLITSLRTDVTSNTSRISVLETDVASNASRVSVLELGNTVQETLINSLRVDVNSNASKLDTLTLNDVININNATSNTVNFTNTVTGLVTAANLEVGSNLTVSGLSASKVPYVDANKVLRDSFITTTGDATVIASNLDVTGNIFMRGEKYVVESETKLINDAIIGIANNNTVATTDVGILMQRPTANVALIHHGSSDKFTIGYTQNDLEAVDIANDTVNQINVNVLGNLFTQNNLTVGSGGSYFGDGTTLTGVALKNDMTSNASRIEVLETDLTSNASRVTILEAANAVQETLITNLRTDMDSNNARVNVLEAANAVQETLITNLRTDVDSNNARVTTLEAANAVQETLITDLRTDMTSNAYRVGTIETELGYPTFSTLGLDGIVNRSNATSNVIKLTNATTGLVADGNIHALNFIGDGGTLSNIATDLQQITENGNTTSNTVQFTNVVTSFITSSNVGVRVAKPEENLHLAGNLRISNTSVLSDKIDFQKIASETIFTSTPHTSWTEEQILVASNPSEYDFFGQQSAVSADGTTIAVGARLEDTTATDSGAVYVYTYGSGTWTQRAMLKASDAQTSDILGEAGLGISDDGQTIVAAAREEDTGGTSAGAVYVFMAGNSTWGSHTQVKLQASNKEAGDQFARCDISGDGNVIIVGAPHEAGPTNSLQGSGAVYMFTRSGNTWSEQQIVRPHDPQVDNYFGVDCALNRTGSVAAIAATGDDTTATDSGAVYIFKRIGGTWHQDAKLKASSPVANNSMGSLALSDNGLTLAAGSAGDDTANSPDSGAVFVFTYAGGAWSQTIKLTGSGAGSGDNLGGRTRISGAGNTIVAGARNNDSLASDAGCAYIFTLTGGTWSEALKITSSAGSSGDLLGDSVSISRDGTVICAGSVTADPNSVLDSGSVNVYRGSGGSVSQSTSTASFRIGDTLSIGSTGDIGIQTNDPAFNLDIHGTANVGPLTVSNTFSLSNVATMGTTKTFVVTAGGGAFNIDGLDRRSLELHENQTYIFDLSSTTLSTHPFVFQTTNTNDGTTNGTNYETGITSTGTYAVDEKRTFTVSSGAPTTLYYYCTAHSGMGGTISISPTAELIVSGRVVASGNVEANTFIGDTFIGDGSQLTGISGATTSGLQVVTTNGATTSDAIQLTNTGTSLTASGGITAAYFTGDGSNLTGISSTLQAITDKGNTTSNTIQFTNGFTSLAASGNVLVTGNVTADYFAGDGSNVTIGEMTATAIPYVDANKQLRDSYITRTIDTTTITSNLRVEGNLVVTGTSYAVDSENMVINDRIIGLANNNTTTTLDTGLMLQYPQKNVAIIHHGTVSGSPHNGQLTIGYTQNTFVHDNIVHDANNITLNVIGHVITQNNITVGAQGSYYGDGTTLTGVALSADLTDNVTRIEDLETATIISNSSGITTGFTRGDIIYASADNVLNKLALGTSGQVLKSDGTDVVWGTDGGGGGSGSTVWQQNGNKIYYSTDNVGINVSDPAFDLDVHGTANVGALTATSLSVGGQTLALASDLSANATRLDALYTATAGDIIYATGTNTLGKLGIGAPGEVLTVVNGFPAWAAATGGGGGGTSQWTTVNTNEIYYDGNVGIANTDPGHDLSVGSNLYVDDDASNVLVVTGNTAMSSLTLGEVSIVASYNLDQIVNTGNVTSNTVQFSNAITSLTAASNVVVAGNVTADYFVGDGSNLTGISSTLQAITDNGNVTSNTIQFSNAITGLVTTANVEVGGELTVSGNATVSSNLTVSGNVSDLNILSNVNMLHTANTAAIKLNSNVVTEFPRSKKLIKYPRVALTSASLNAYENGYKVTFSSDYGTDGTTWAADHVFDSDIRDATSSWASDGGLYSGGSYIGGASIGGFSGEYVHLELPVSINLSLVRMLPRTYQIPCPQAPKDYSIIASTDGVTYDLLERVVDDPDTGIFKEIHINTPKSYNRFAIVVEKTIGSDVAAISEIEYYGVPEYDPEAHGTDVVVKSDANVPNTDWLERYYDATNYSSGTTILDEVTATHRDATINGTVPLDTSDGIKSWSFTGNVSNFILGDDIIDGISSTTSGDWVHSMSIWFKTTLMADHQYIAMVLPSVNLDGSTLATGSASSFMLRRKALADGVDSRRRLQIVHWGQDVRVDYTFSENEWYNVTYTYSGGGTTSATERVYVNGLYVPFIESTRTAATNGDNLNVNSSSRVVLGKRYYTSSPYPFHGNIANFRIFKRALSSYEAWQLYAYQKEYFGHGDLSMTLNAGRLGIGTSKPRAALDVRGNVQVRGDIHGGCPIYFAAYNTNGTAAGNTVIWNELWMSRGGGYDTGTGIFTVPLAGIYKFYYTLRQSGAAGTALYARIQLNGSDLSVQYGAIYLQTTRDQAGSTVLLKLNAGDKISVKVYNYDMASGYSSFVGEYFSSL